TQRDKLKTYSDRAAVVRDTSLTALATMASGGTSLAVTAGVVAGGAALKTGSQESALRVEGQGRDAKGIAKQYLQNTVGLAADAAGGTAGKALTTAAKAGQISQATALAGRATVNVVTGAGKRAADGKDAFDLKAVGADAVGGLAGGTADAFKSRSVAAYLGSSAASGIAGGAAKRAIAGEKIFDARAMVADGITGAGGAAVGQKLAPGIEKLKPAAGLAASTAAGSAVAAGSQV